MTKNNLTSWSSKEIDNLKKEIKEIIQKIETITDEAKKRLFIKLSLILIIRESTNCLNLDESSIDEYKLKTKEKLVNLSFNDIKVISTGAEFDVDKINHLKGVFSKKNIYLNPLKIQSNFFIYYLLKKYFNNDQEILKVNFKKLINNICKKNTDSIRDKILEIIINVLKSKINRSYENEYILFLDSLKPDDLLIIYNNTKHKSWTFQLAALNYEKLINLLIKNKIPVMLIEEKRLKNLLFKSMKTISFNSTYECNIDLINLICNDCDDFRKYDLKQIRNKYIIKDILEGE